MNRRLFLKASGFAGIGLASVGGYNWLTTAENKAPLTIDAAVTTLNDILKLDSIKTHGNWTAHQVFNHIAQSIEYSMTGYPQHKSDIFKSTVGSAAFSVFSSKGYMKHNLSEWIPGEPIISDHGNTMMAVMRAKQAFVDFAQFEGPLQPHFAYGPLSKREYEAAHVMHLYNHMEELLWG